MNGTTTSSVVALQATEAMCYHCFDVLVEELQGSNLATNQKRSASSQTNHNHNTTTMGMLSTGWRPFRSNSNNSNSSNNSSSSHSRSRQQSATTKTKTTTIPDFCKDLPDPAIECPLFITWDKSRPKGGGLSFPVHHLLQQTQTQQQQQQQQTQVVYELRGCIGTLTPKPLLSALGDYALTSALRDRRFHPITASEIPQLRVAVSLLVQYEPCQHCLDWIVGTHGILIRFWWPHNNTTNTNTSTNASTTHNNGGTSSSSSSSREYSATYLPEVAQEQGWDQKASVMALIRKAGYTGVIDDALLEQIQCTRYQSSKVRMTFDEYSMIHRKKQQLLNNNTNSTVTTNTNNNNEEGMKSLPSTEPSSASSSFHYADVVAENGNDDDDLQQLNHPPKQWNTCNNL